MKADILRVGPIRWSGWLAWLFPTPEPRRIDPDAAYREVVSCCEDFDYEQALPAIEDLIAWLEDGGRLPGALEPKGRDGALSHLRTLQSRVRLELGAWQADRSAMVTAR